MRTETADLEKRYLAESVSLDTDALKERTVGMRATNRCKRAGINDLHTFAAHVTTDVLARHALRV